jgi:DNA polymerase IV (DinB-like DNA polymerase)
MSAAKIASDHDKPDGLTIVPPADVRSFLSALPIADLHGVGPVSAKALSEMGIHTIGDLAEADIESIESRFGERGRELHNRARGIDDRDVTERPEPKSLSRETSFGEPESDFRRVEQQVMALARAVTSRVEQNGALYRTAGVKVVTPPYDVHTREYTFSGPINESDLLRETARSLLEEFDGETIRKVGVSVSNLSFPDNEQSDLDTWEESDEQRNGEGPKTRIGQVPLEAFTQEE